MSHAPVPLVVYGDFNCPYSCLASQRVDKLVTEGAGVVEWGAVDHDPSVPVPSRVVSGPLAEMLDAEIDQVRGLLRPTETLPIRRPSVQPNTRFACAALAGTDPGRQREVRQRLFAALWIDGDDIGDETIVRGITGPAPENGACRAESWRTAWSGLERPMVPMLVLPGGVISRGLGALTRLADLAGSS